MSTNQSVDNDQFEGFKFKVIGSNHILNIIDVDNISTDHEFIETEEFNGLRKRFSTGTITLRIQCHCKNSVIKHVDRFMLKEGYLFVSPQIPPLKGYFTEYHASALMAKYIKLDMSFIGSMSYIEDVANEAKQMETKVTTKKESRKKRTIKRKLSF